jgi:uncharacterized protein (DUF2132 family)
MFKRKKIVEHDSLCSNNPCICSQLQFLRRTRAAEKAIKEIQIKQDLARKALDGTI